MLIKKVMMALFAVGLVSGCHAMERAAAQDPMKCERDPKCEKKSRAADCSTQCVDDRACMERCAQINQGTGAGAVR